MAINLSTQFVQRPVATTLLGVAIALSGMLAFANLPVSPLPDVDFPTLAVTASLPGADPQTVASSVALPLERQFTSIAGITEMTSTSYTGSVRIVLQFDLDRDSNGAARDVQAAIDAARSRLPSDLHGSPTYRKVNPAAAPVFVLALTSDAASVAQMYDYASTVLQQKLLQTEGVGDVLIGGGALPATRVELEPDQLTQRGIALEQVRQTLAQANRDDPKGDVAIGERNFTLAANDNLLTSRAYLSLAVRNADGAVVRIGDLGEVRDSIENLRNFGVFNGRPAVAIIISKRPGANVVATVNRIKGVLPQLAAAIPANIKLDVVLDRTQTIQSSLHDVEVTLVAAVLLVIAVTWAFFRDWRATLVPAVVVPLSLLGTFAVMWACGFSLNILSLMALTISTGFVVDDAIVVVENILRHLTLGKSRIDAALDGASEVGFTVFSISLSLVAVFIPLLLMGGLVGRLFREFSVTLAAAILVSMVVSLALTPMMSRMVLRTGAAGDDAISIRDDGWYGRSLRAVLMHPRRMIVLTIAAFLFSAVLMVVIPKGFFPQQDTGLLVGQVLGPQNISFDEMRRRFVDVVATLRKDPDLQNVFGFVGGSGINANNTGAVYATLKPLGQRRTTAMQLIARLHDEFADATGVSVILQAIQDIGVGGRQTAAQYQYTLSADHMSVLDVWAPKVEAALRALPMLADVGSDKQDQSLDVMVDIDRDAAARLGVSMTSIDQTLYDAFGQRQVSTLYRPMNQYHVVMELAPRYWQDPSALRSLYVPTTASPTTLVSLSAIARMTTRPTAISLSHQGQFPSVTLSFNLKPGASIGPAIQAVNAAVASLNLPRAINAGFGGSARASAATTKTMPLLVVAALAAVYIVLGMLYESFAHPLTILSTLPSAGVGALLALLLFRFEFSLIALIGIILLVGIVKKNAIMMIDFALKEERERGMDSLQSIYRASLIRFRPIMMTTLAAILGALPLLFGSGYGSEFRKPLGASIIGGLLLSQLLTLYSTPAIYLCMDRLRQRRGRGNPHER